MNMLKRHLGFVVLLAIVAPLTFAFCWHGVLASLGDDSMSYIVVARWLWPFAHDELSAPWVGYYSHFPPVFPALLAITGGARDFFIAHMVVAASAVAALAATYAYGVQRLGSPRAGLGLAIAFVAMPTAWISVLGILSEPLFLALSLATIVFHARSDPSRDTRAAICLGLLLAATWLTRAAGAALVAAYLVHVAFRAIQTRKRPALPELLPVLIAVGAELAWLAVRPHLASKGYGTDVWTFAGRWLDHPMLMTETSGGFLVGGWISSFGADSGVPLSIRAVLWVVALLGLAGAIRGALRNRLDSWYVLAATAILFLWVFSEDNTRRLIYPLVALLLAHAAEMLTRFRRWAMPIGMALVVAVSAPATLLVANKAFDREALIPDTGYNPSAMTDYYVTVNLKAAKALAWRHAAVLAGLEYVDRLTPPGARVLWVRPEYVAVLGRRQGVPSYSSWDRAELGRQILATGTTHVIATRLFKSDLADRGGDAYALLVTNAPEYLRHPALLIQNSETEQVEFALLEVDREALEREVKAPAPR